ncbi:MAG: hypothetical protein KDG51_12995, partial [Calditrichaeota bacterium]|nr:hypothetical protein [Calditrichota bacterium]
MNSDKAQALLTHNAGILGQAVDSTVLSDAQQVYEVNSQWLAAAEKQNNTRAEGQAFKFSDKLVGYDYDAAFPTLLKNLLPVGYGILGFVLAAIFGAVVSSLASMLNSASTIATMDIYNKVKSSASQFELVT